jgi:hypothetical protein
MFVESVRGFLLLFYIVRPETQIGINALCTRVLDKNADGTIKSNKDNIEKMKYVGRFPMSWTKEHFEKETKDYLTADTSLTNAEKQGFKVL